MIRFGLIRGFVLVALLSGVFAVGQEHDPVQRAGPDHLLDLDGQQVPVQHRAGLHQVLAERDGRELDSDAARLKEFGAAIHRLQTGNLALHHLPTTPEVAAALDGNTDTFWSAPVGSHHSILEVDFAKPSSIDRVTTMEWLNDGQHVEEYAIEVWTDHAWECVASAQAIGHEKTDRFPAVVASRIRLNILSSSQEAHIREFQVYDDGSSNR